MISFIIIGRNEGWKLTKCFKSVFDTIEYNNFKEYEVIYVDSKSTDDSIQRAKEFKEIKIFQITGRCNAAIGRNIGAKESKGDILFFIDGDMEIIPEFLSNVLNKQDKLIYPFISGVYWNYYYNNNGDSNCKKTWRNKILTHDIVENTSGGIFIIDRSLWDQCGGMKNKLIAGEDPDLGLRLAKKGVKKIRKKNYIAIHHTRDNITKLFKISVYKPSLYAKSTLYREHILNWHIYPIIIRHDYGLILLSFSILLTILGLEKLFIISWTLYCILMLAKTIKKTKSMKFLSMLFYNIIKDFVVLIGCFVFWPKKIEIEDIDYKLIN